MIKSKIIIVVVLVLLGLVLLLYPTTTQSTLKDEVPLPQGEVESQEIAEVATSTEPVSRETPKVQATGSKAEYLGIVQEKAVVYGVSASLMIAIIDCENRSWTANLQSGHYYKKDRPKQGLVTGQREQSFGLVQIHLPDHPSISYEQATNPTFSIEFLARELSLNRGRQWSCYSPALAKISQPDSPREHALEKEQETNHILKEVGTAIDNTLEATQGLAL